MSAKHLSLVMAALGAAAAMAPAHAQHQPLTRAEVKAEIERARASGELQQINSDYAFDTLKWPQAASGYGGAQGRRYGSPALPSTPNAERAAPLYMGEEGE